MNINGDTNITTEVDKDNKKVSIKLKEALTGINSVGKDDNNKITFDGGTKIKANGAELTLTKDNSNKVKLSGLADGKNEYDAVNFKQLEASKLHFLSVKGDNSKKNYDNKGAKAANSVAIGVDVEAQNGAESAVLVGHNLNTNVKHSVVMGSNINIEQEANDSKDRKDAVVAIGSGVKLKMRKARS